MNRADSDYGLRSSASSIDPDESSSSVFSDDSSLDSNFEFECDPIAQQLCLRADSLESLDEMATDNNNEAEFMAFKNTRALCEDLRFITGMHEMCDVKFLVGKDEVPVYGVKAVLATRSRGLYNLILSQEKIDRKEMLASKKRSGLVSKLRQLKYRKLSSSKTAQTVQRKTDEKASSHVTIEVKEFDPDTFRRIILFIQSGDISVNINNVIGVMNAADTYGLDDLLSACFHFARRFINLKTILPLLSTTQLYSEFRWTKKIVNEIMSFVTKNSQDILSLHEFEHLSKESVISILLRRNLRASEETKWDAALMWSRRHCINTGDSLRNTLKLFTHTINFLDIPLSKLLQEVHPLYMVPGCETIQTKDHQCVPVDHDVIEIPAGDFRDRKSSVSSSCSEGSRGGRSTDSGYDSSSDICFML